MYIYLRMLIIKIGMLSKLKTECGSNFTAKLEGMFQDVELSKAAMSAFNQYTTSSSSSGSATITSAFDATLMSESEAYPSSSFSSSAVPVAHDHNREHEPECYVQLLTAGYWPSSPSGMVYMSMNIYISSSSTTSSLPS
jgi:hypothetical protein